MKTNKKQILIVVVVLVLLLGSIPLLAYFLRTKEKAISKKHLPPIEVVRNAFYKEFYGYCQGRPSYPQSEIPSIAEAKIKVPSNVGWCMRQWVVRDKAAQWWAADVSGLKIEPFSDDGYNVWVKITYDAWVATELPVEGKPAKIEHTKPTRKMLFVQDSAGKWVFQGIDKDLTPDEY